MGRNFHCAPIVLPEDVAGVDRALARFETEARAVAAHKRYADSKFIGGLNSRDAGGYRWQHLLSAKRSVSPTEKS